MERVVGIGEYMISDSLDDSLKTYALSSCVALTAYNPMKKVLGLAHIVLPQSRIDDNIQQPGYYADIAVPMMISRLCNNYGCPQNGLIFSLYGGANSIKENDFFNIGYKNINAVKKILLEHNLNLSIEETGGIKSRTIEMDVATGNVRIQYNHIII